MTNYKTVIYFVSSLILSTISVQAQIKTYPIQDFNFGTFYQGLAGGTISISSTGSRTTTGDIIVLNSWAGNTQAMFDIEAPAGSTISILNGPDVTLAGSNGGTVTLHLAGTDLGSSFITSAAPPARTRINLAGQLIIGNQVVSPPGAYQGTFTLIFNQE
jgi:hypothetical protein